MEKILNLIYSKKKLTAFFAGMLVTLAFPPIFITPILFISFPLLLTLINKAETKKQSFWIGWWFGFGHFVTSLYWISISLLVEPEKFAWLIPFAVSIIPAVMAIYPAISTWLLKILNLKFNFSKAQQIIVFSLLWLLTEHLRSILFTGFPWNLIGYVWTVSDITTQTASIFGIYGLSLFAILIFSTPYAIKDKRFIIPIILLSIFIGGYGYYRVNNAHNNTVKNVRLRLIQGNIPQNLKWNIKERIAILQKQIAMTTSEGFDDITHAIWSESALPFTLSENSPIMETLKNAVHQNGLLITGAVRMENNTGFNSIIAVNKLGKIVGKYDKVHLVPFGEYVPFRNIVLIDKIAGDYYDFIEGNEVKPMSLINLPLMMPQICYESIFQDLASYKGNPKPKWILNITNDTWFGNSIGPYQHFNMVRIRAVEQGIPVIRVANSGITGVIDAYGRVKSFLPYGISGILDADLPMETSSMYSRYGYIPLFVLMFLLGGFVLLFNRKQCV